MPKGIPGRTKKRWALVTGAALGLAAAAPTQAHAAGFTLRPAQSLACLDGSLSQGVRVIPCNGSAYQLWSRGDYTFVHAATGRCLDGSLSQGVRVVTCNGSSYQVWPWRGDELVNSATGKCLDGSLSQGARLLTCNGSDYQRWY